MIETENVDPLIEEEIADLSDDSQGEDVQEELIDDEEEVYECSLSSLSQVEALLLACQKPMKIPEIADYLTEELDHQSIKYLVEELQESYNARDSGIEVAHIKGQGFRIQTRSTAAPLMQRLFACRPRPLSRSAQETIAIIVYRQPVTRAEIEFIRGVDAGSIVKSLMDRGFIKCVGRKDVPGRPMLFATTDEFLRVFGLESIKDLPSLESFQSQEEILKKAEKEIENFEQGEDGLDSEAKTLEPDLGAVDSDTDVEAVLNNAEISSDVIDLKEKTAIGESLIHEVLDTE